MKKIVSLILIVVLLCGSLAMSSCARQSDDEARAIVRDLIERSYNLNVAYYGQGLPYDSENQVEGNYYHVAEDAPFKVRNDLIVETKAVFSDRIATDLIKVYIDGTSSYGVVVYARYITGYDGYLTVYKDYDYILENVQKYNPETIELEKNSRKEIKATVQSYDGTSQIEVVLVYEVDGWRIDSPTY